MAELKSGVTVVLGGQWGDEGKGKLVDILAQEADIVARCQVRISCHAMSLIDPPTSLWYLNERCYIVSITSFLCVMYII